MSILAECPICRTKQSNKKKICKMCGEDLEKAKKSERVRYWVVYRLEDGTQRRKSSGFKLKDARDLDSKKKVQKREKKLFDDLQGADWTFLALQGWYLNLTSVKSLKSYKRVQQALNNFNHVFGKTLIRKLTKTSLEGYQIDRQKEGKSLATIDMEITYGAASVRKAYDDNLIPAEYLRPFRKLSKLLRKGGNARGRIISKAEYEALIENASPHLRNALILAMNTGMRSGEIRQLQHTHIDRNAGLIRFPANLTKEKKEKIIPINHHVSEMLDGIIRRVDCNHVINYMGKPITFPGGLLTSFKATCRRANVYHGRNTIDGITLHDFRRSVKTYMLKADVNKIYRDTLLGHSLTGMDIHYIHIDEEDLIRAMDKYTYWLDNKWGCESEKVDHFVDQKKKGA